MRKLLIILFILVGGLLNATTYYVATTGNNGNPGTISQPWATFQYAFTYGLVAGDTVYFRGGTYYVTSAQANTAGLDGTEANPICFFAYPGETPIVDGINKTSQGHGMTFYYSSFLKFKGIVVRNHAQFSSSSFPSAWNMYYCEDIHFENCVVSNIGGRGFAGRWCSRMTFINCDAYSCDDVLSGDPDGGNGDGFFLSPSYHDYTGQSYFYGCRAWKCSDDGWDIENLGLIVLENCWAFDNGFAKYSDGAQSGMGNGFKIALSPAEDVSELNRLIINCIGVYNRRCGLVTNDRGYGARWYHIYNNSFYGNGLYGQTGYGIQIFNTSSADAAEQMRIFRNNLSYGNTTSAVYYASGATATEEYNSWNTPPGVTITSGDFVSVDSTGLTGSRQSDGSLPELYFLRLITGSDLIDAGIDVGVSYNGTAPDLGAWDTDGDIDSTATSILLFTLDDQLGAATINSTAHIVEIEVSYTADITALAPTLTLSYGATVIPASGVARDFTNPVPYTVTALDGVTYQEWTVTVTQEEAPEVPPVASTGSIVKFNGKIVKR